jgi:DNA-binding LytR/AlgR family response regulator
MNVQRYLELRRPIEVGFWVLFFLVHGLANAAVVAADFRRSGIDFPVWEPLVLEGTSMLAMALLLPLILAFDRRFPLRFSTLRRAVPAHLLASVAYTLAHVFGMTVMRHAAYAVAGVPYEVGPWSDAIAYEYLKDSRAYAGMLATVYLYRFLLVRLQGEASLLVAPDEGEPVEPIDRPQRLLVKKLGKEFLINLNDVEWMEASGNYVNLHVAKRAYPLRETMANLGQRTDPERFVRVHRRFMVNLDHVVEIEPLEGGDARIRLKDGTRIPFSRRCRSALRGRF